MKEPLIAQGYNDLSFYGMRGVFTYWPQYLLDIWEPLWLESQAVQDMVSKLSRKE